VWGSDLKSGNFTHTVFDKLVRIGTNYLFPFEFSTINNRPFLLEFLNTRTFSHHE